MGLRIRLKPHERVIINGCVIENGDRRNTITVSNFAQVLKSSDILQEADATTPLRQLYFVIQLMLIDERVFPRYSKWANAVAARLYQKLPSRDDRALIMSAMDKMHYRDYYRALTDLKKLIRQEDATAPIYVETPLPLKRLLAHTTG